MKGVVFTAFLDYCEKHFSMETIEKVIAESNLPSQASYTSVGTYPPEEMFELLTHLSKEVHIPVSELLKRYGKYLFGVFKQKYPEFFVNTSNTFQFLKNVEDYIHVEVRKLYPDANLPHFDFETPSEKNRMIMIYRSKYPMGDLAEGLIQGCAEYHNENIEINRKDLSSKEGTTIEFDLRLKKGKATQYERN